MEHVDLLMGVILPFANFFIFLGLAIYFFRKPARNAAQKKRDEFVRNMNEAKRTFDEANEKLAQLKRRQENLAAEIEDIKNTSLTAAEAESNRIVNEAERLAVHLKEEAKRIASAEVQKARATLRHEIIVAVNANVKDKIAKEVSADMHHNIVRKNIAELRTIKVEG